MEDSEGGDDASHSDGRACWEGGSGGAAGYHPGEVAQQRFASYSGRRFGVGGEGPAAFDFIAWVDERQSAPKPLRPPPSALPWVELRLSF